MLRLLKPLRRWKWLDILLTRVESYGALLEQWGFRPSGRTIIEVVVAILVGAWTILSESWLPVGIAIAIVVFVALTAYRRMGSFVRLAASSGGSAKAPLQAPNSTSDPNQLTLQEIAKIRDGHIKLLFVALYGVYISQFAGLLAAAPDFRPDDPINDAGEYSKQREAADKYVEDVVRGLRRTRFIEGLNFHLNRVEFEAKAKVKETPQDERPQIDHIEYLEYMVSMQRLTTAAWYLGRIKEEVETDYRGKMYDLIAAYSEYEKG